MQPHYEDLMIVSSSYTSINLHLFWFILYISILFRYCSPSYPLTTTISKFSESFLKLLIPKFCLLTFIGATSLHLNLLVFPSIFKFCCWLFYLISASSVSSNYMISHWFNVPNALFYPPITNIWFFWINIALCIILA